MKKFFIIVVWFLGTVLFCVLVGPSNTDLTMLVGLGSFGLLYYYIKKLAGNSKLFHDPPYKGDRAVKSKEQPEYLIDHANWKYDFNGYSIWKDGQWINVEKNGLNYKGEDGDTYWDPNDL